VWGACNISQWRWTCTVRGCHIYLSGCDIYTTDTWSRMCGCEHVKTPDLKETTRGRTSYNPGSSGSHGVGESGPPRFRKTPKPRKLASPKGYIRITPPKKASSLPAAPRPKLETGSAPARRNADTVPKSVNKRQYEHDKKSIQWS